MIFADELVRNARDLRFGDVVSCPHATYVHEGGSKIAGSLAITCAYEFMDGAKEIVRHSSDRRWVSRDIQAGLVIRRGVIVGPPHRVTVKVVE